MALSQPLTAGKEPPSATWWTHWNNRIRVRAFLRAGTQQRHQVASPSPLTPIPGAVRRLPETEPIRRLDTSVIPRVTLVQQNVQPTREFISDAVRYFYRLYRYLPSAVAVSALRFLGVGAQHYFAVNCASCGCYTIEVVESPQLSSDVVWLCSWETGAEIFYHHGLSRRYPKESDIS